jgi:WXG100 family type VII secretion target
VSSFSYAVDLDLARDVVASLAAVESELDEVVVDLRWRVARLHETWAGTAAAAHLTAHGSWEASYREMHEALVAMRRALGTAASNYFSAGSDNASMWNAVR